MPSRWANTGTRASCWTRPTRLLPPRGTITSRAAVEALEHFTDRGAIGRRHELDRGCRQFGLRRGRRSRQAWIARAEWKLSEPLRKIAALPDLRQRRAGIGGDVRPAFVDHANDAQRRAHALDLELVRHTPFRDRVADRIGQLGNGLEALPPWRRHAWCIEGEAVDECVGAAGILGGGEIEGIGRDDVVGFLAQGNAAAAAVSAVSFLVARGQLRRPRRPDARTLAERLHDLGRIFDHSFRLVHDGPFRLSARFKRHIIPVDELRAPLMPENTSDLT